MKHPERAVLLALCCVPSLAAAQGASDADWEALFGPQPESSKPASQEAEAKPSSAANDTESESASESGANRDDSAATSGNSQDEAADETPMIPVATLRAPEAEPPVAPQRRAALEEIVVTAQKKAESLQDTPISLAAFDEEKLEVGGIQGLADLSGNVPSLAIEPFPTSNATLRFYIRGIGVIDAQVTQDPAIGVYMDGVYIARSSGNALDIADLQRVEVLRGPQGTLYGRNTTGGAINLITKAPSVDGVQFTQKFSVGNRNYAQSKTSLNYPFSDEFAAKISLIGSQKDGFVENTGPGSDFGDRKVLGSRVDLRWLPTEQLSLDYGYEDSTTTYVNYMYQAVLTPEGNKGQAEIFKRYGESQSVYSSRRLKSLASGAPMEDSTTDISGHTFKATYGFDNHELKYIGAYRELSDASYADLSGGAGSTSYRLDTHAYDGPASDFAYGGPTPLWIPTTTQSQWSHELQLTGSLFDDSVSYITGAFYFTEKAREDRHVPQHQFSTAISPDQTADVVAALRDLGVLPVNALLPRLVNFTALDNSIVNDALALFGQATWTPDLLDQRMHFTFGFRHSEDQREAVKFRTSDTYVEYSLNGQGAAVPLSSAEEFQHEKASRTFSDNSMSFIAEFDATDTINTYAKYVEAYKSGGFNTRDPQVSGESGEASDGKDYGYGFAEGFEPEHVKSYELGIKTELLDRRLRLNADVFLTDYDDMQINFLIIGTVNDTKTRNAGNARLYGFEIDGNWLATDDLLLNASYAYLNAEILEVTDTFGADVTNQYQFSSAPPHSYTVSGDWTALRGDDWQLNAHLGYNYVGKRLGGAKAGQPVQLDPYGIVNARLGVDGLRLGSGNLSVALWGKNLLDEDYAINAIDNLPHADRAVIWGEPRTFGMDVTYRYGN